MKKVCILCLCVLSIALGFDLLAAAPSSEKTFLNDSNSFLSSGLEEYDTTVEVEIEEFSQQLIEDTSMNNQLKRQALLNVIDFITLEITNNTYVGNTDITEEEWRETTCNTIAYLNLFNYKFSIELLLHMFANEEEYSYYDPIYKDVLFHSKYYNEVYFNSQESGSLVFNSMENVIERDCFLSIHACSFIKNGTNLVIDDDYDFIWEEDYWDVVNIMNNLMYVLQELNLVKIFQLNIIGSTPHNSIYSQTIINGYHKITCNECSISYVDGHKLGDYSYDANVHTIECEYCSYESTNIHDLDICSISNTKHSKQCECGYYEEFSHDFKYTPYSSTQHVSLCSTCGKSVYQDHEWTYRVSPSSDEEYEIFALIKKYYCKYCGVLKYSK